MVGPYYAFLVSFDYFLNKVDGAILDTSDDHIHRFYINNNLTASHQYVILGLRELKPSEPCSNNLMLPPISDQPFQFSSDYEMRVYTSACYYLDSNNNWQSNGLLVSSFYFILVILSRLPLGGSYDKSLSNTMFLYSLDNIHQCIFESS